MEISLQHNFGDAYNLIVRDDLDIIQANKEHLNESSLVSSMYI